MTAEEERVRNHIRNVRPHAKFILVSHSRDFIDAEAKLGDGFFNANLYDERIDANLIHSAKLGYIMVENTYISSFAFNMFLCWLASYRQEFNLPSRDVLLAHNFKKFFAEQIYRLANCVPSRALLLETLLFEQVCMVPVFAARQTDAQLSAQSEAATNLMSLALSTHELGHYRLATAPEEWSQLVAAEPDTIGYVYGYVLKTNNAKLIVEFQCDAYAIVSCLSQCKTKSESLFTSRTLVFSFAAYSAMYSAFKTAQATAPLWRADMEEINLRDISAHPHKDHDTRFAYDEEFSTRARWVEELCQQFAARDGLELFGSEDPFPLPSSIRQDLSAYVDRVFECEDGNARKMSNLVAQSLAYCDEAMEYLYLRSKTFQTNRDEPLIV